MFHGATVVLCPEPLKHLCWGKVDSPEHRKLALNAAEQVGPTDHLFAPKLDTVESPDCAQNHCAHAEAFSSCKSDLRQPRYWHGNLRTGFRRRLSRCSRIPTECCR